MIVILFEIGKPKFKQNKLNKLNSKSFYFKIKLSKHQKVKLVFISIAGMNNCAKIILFKSFLSIISFIK